MLTRVFLQSRELQKLMENGQVIRTYGDTMTADELASRLWITTRSINRILSHLEDAGYAILTGKRSAGKGRPTRLMKISLPECFLT